MNPFGSCACPLRLMEVKKGCKLYTTFQVSQAPFSMPLFFHHVPEIQILFSPKLRSWFFNPFLKCACPLWLLEVEKGCKLHNTPQTRPAPFSLLSTCQSSLVRAGNSFKTVEVMVSKPILELYMPTLARGSEKRVPN